MSSQPPVSNNGGRGEIRTHGAVTLGGFQDRCLKPLGHPSVVMHPDLIAQLFLIFNMIEKHLQKNCRLAFYQLQTTHIWTQS